MSTDGETHFKYSESLIFDRDSIPNASKAARDYVELGLTAEANMIASTVPGPTASLGERFAHALASARVAAETEAWEQFATDLEELKYKQGD